MSPLVEDGKTIAGPDLPREESAAAPVRIADRTWLLVVRDPSQPGSRPGGDDRPRRPLAGGPAGGPGADLEPQRTHAGAAPQASHDPLTGLKNRRRFEEDLRTELARSHRYASRGALLMLDLDHFKQVNDTLGHPAGDRVIAEIAEVLRGRARETDVVARLGGDEFAVVLPRCGIDEARGGRGRDRHRDPRAHQRRGGRAADHRQHRHRPLRHRARG